MSQAHCPECSGPLQRATDETVCQECGLVVDEHRIDHGPEWRSFADDDTDRERTGAPLTRSRHDRGLSTEIGRDTRLKGRKRRRLARMRREHSRARISSKAERNRVYGFSQVRRLVAALDLPRDVREQACVLFESAQSEGLLHGRSLEGFAAAAVYAVCRTRSISRGLAEVLEPARADEGELKAAYGAMNRELGLETGPVHPREYVPRFASDLDVPEAVERGALELAAEVRESGIDVGRNPRGVAAACLYTAAVRRDHDLTQADAAEAGGVSPVTLRKTYTDLQD